MTTTIHHCSCEELAGHVPAGSLDAVFTDPPYVAESIPAYGELARFAVHALRPGGLLLTIIGQYHLPAIIRELDVPGLSYR